MNGYKILKCFRKEKRVSGVLPCPATGLIAIGNDWDSYFEQTEFSTFATILDFSVCHQLHQCMLAFSDTTDRAEHFGV